MFSAEEQVLKRPVPWFEILAGAICALWATAAWITVIPNQDMLVDASQVQRLLQDPQIVLAFPGQKHGGVLEYPYLLLSELIAPGNFYLHTALRIVFAFLTGFFTARLFLRLFPGFPRWSFLAVMAVGPTIMHGLSGPPENKVGVWWLVGNYDLSWLLVTAGALVLVGPNTRPFSKPSNGRVVVAGLLVGLGIYEHPMILLLVAPLGVLTILRRPIALRQLLLVAIGLVIGVVPLGVSYFINAGITKWDPSHFPVFDPNLALAVLGLNSNTDYFTSLLPYAIGLSTTSEFLNPRQQSLVILVLLIWVGLALIIGGYRWIRYRSQPSAGFAVAASWMVAALAMIAFSTVVNPVWFYAAGLAILLWLSVGALPGLFAHRMIGTVLAVVVIAVIAVSTWTHNVAWYSEFTTRGQDKLEYMHTQKGLADTLLAGGVKNLYGSYYDVIPIGYASGGDLRFITNTYNRFPLSEVELASGELEVAVNTKPTDGWGDESLLAARENCVPTMKFIRYQDFEYEAFTCRSDFFTEFVK